MVHRLTEPHRHSTRSRPPRSPGRRGATPITVRRPAVRPTYAAKSLFAKVQPLRAQARRGMPAIASSFPAAALFGRAPSIQYSAASRLTPNTRAAFPLTAEYPQPGCSVSRGSHG